MKKISRFIAGLAAACAILTIAAPASAQTNKALEFNGISDFVELTTTPARLLTGDYTLEAWAYPASTTSTARRIISNFQTIPSRGYGMGTRNTNWRITTFGIKDYDTAVNTQTSGTWTHLAVTLDSSNTARFYTNGQLLTTITHGTAARESTRTLWLGANPTGTEFWHGRIDEVRIWNKVRTPEEIANTWNRALRGDEAGLVAYYPFNEGSGTTTEDVTSGFGDGVLNGCTWVDGPALLEPYNSADQGWLQQP